MVAFVIEKIQDLNQRTAPISVKIVGIYVDMQRTFEDNLRIFLAYAAEKRRRAKSDYKQYDSNISMKQVFS